MSPCPKGHGEAVHVGVVVPWDNTLDPPEVLHFCGVTGCGFFLEPAKDVSAMFAKVEWWLQGFDPEAIQAQGNKEAKPDA